MAAPAARTTVHLRLLGVPAWQHPGDPWQTLAAKDALLLARLRLQGAAHRTVLASWLWPQVPVARANANLRQRLFRLRQAGAALVLEDQQRLQLAPGVGTDLDADTDTDTGPANGQALPTGAAALPAPLLHSIDPALDDPTLADWLAQARQLWAARQLDQLAGRALRQQAAGALAAALSDTELLLTLDPLREHSWRLLMRLHHQRGDRAAAIAAFERCEQVLRSELGVRPGSETLALLADCEHLARPAPQALGRAPLPPALLRPPRRVGRDTELARMVAAWQAARPFLLMAPSGLGKSRLLADFASTQPALLQVAARPGDEAMPYGLLARLLRQAAAATPAPGRPALHWLQDDSLRRELARLLPELGPPPAAAGHAVLLQAALDAALAGLVQAGWTGVLVDDLQHADVASRDTVWRLAAAGGPLRWGLASRPTALVPDMVSSARLECCVLHPLNDADALALLASLAPLPGLHMAMATPGGDAADGGACLPLRLVRHCGGNPLFLLETLKLLVLQPALASTAHWPVPASVQAVLDSRLAALSATALALVRVAALTGAHGTPDLAARCLGLGGHEQAAAVAELQHAQVLGNQGLAHDLVRDAVLGAWPAALQAPWHGQLASLLQAEGGAAATVAQHAALGGHWALAARAGLQAAAHARQLGRSAEGLAHLQQAADAWARAGDDEAAFQARLAAVEPVLASAGLQPALQACDALADSAGTAPARLCQLALVRAEVALNGYLPDAAEQAARQALAWLAAPGPGAAGPARRHQAPAPGDPLRAHLLLAAALALRGQVAEALDTAAPWRAALQHITQPLQAAALWSQWALVQHAAGRLQACEAALHQQQTWARQAADVAAEAQAVSSLASIHLARGNAAQSTTLARHAGDLHRRMGDLHSALLADVNLAIALIGSDRLLDAQTVLHRLQAQLPEAADSQLAWIVPELQAEWHLRLNQPEAAWACVAAAPPADAPLPRRLNRGLLQALAWQLRGDGQRAAAAWRALGLAADTGRGAGVQLRAQALASVALPLAAARRQLDSLLQRADAAPSPPAAALTRMRRAAVALRAGDLACALADARWLMARRSQTQHLYVDGGELLALVHRVLLAAGRRSAAARVARSARQWFDAQLLPQLPPGTAVAWCQHPAHAELFGPLQPGAAAP